ncbi:hypothetical protein ACH5RR_012696 [Cinchona calisaya]|uniref:Uncharacterized protein n=1 Tax=Cinchona calisaya TaxID=153742 RepID=A0ABD3ABW0_9GENT
MHEVNSVNAIVTQHQDLNAQLSTTAMSLRNLNVNVVNVMSNHNLGACESCGKNHKRGASMCSRGSTSNRERSIDNEVVLCHCAILTEIKALWKDTNPSRRFHGCSRYVGFEVKDEIVEINENRPNIDPIPEEKEHDPKKEKLGVVELDNVEGAKTLEVEARQAKEEHNEEDPEEPIEVGGELNEIVVELEGHLNDEK